MRLRHGSDQRLRDRVALVTGAGGTVSIGRSIAIRLAEEGARIAVLDIDASGAEKVAGEIRAGGGVALGIGCDVTVLRQCEAAAAQVAQAWDGRIDILVNNAAAIRGALAGQGRRPFDEWTVDDWDYQFDVNVRGQWFCARAVVPYMKARRYGKIINLASSSFFEGVTGLIHYTSSKGGVIGFTRALGKELGPLGIRVNALAPGFTLTEVNPGSGPEDAEIADMQRRAQALDQRNELPEDLTGPAFFLASEDSDFMTCQTILVDGGRSMW